MGEVTGNCMVLLAVSTGLICFCFEVGGIRAGFDGRKSTVREIVLLTLGDQHLALAPEKCTLGDQHLALAPENCTTS